MRGLRSWARVLLGLIAVQSAASYSNYPRITDRTFIQEYLDAHNGYRAAVNPPASDMLYMTFDLGLAKLANAWVQKCIYGHNPRDGDHPDPKFRPFGENIWYGGSSSKKFSSVGPIRSFHDEVKDYNYTEHKCKVKRVCGHYTQVVWASTYKVGCAVYVCPSVKRRYKKGTAVMVCTYGPPGNYRGVRPYRLGIPCSQCPKGNTCENNLCRDAEREKEYGGQDQQFIQDCVNYHNYFRSQVNPSASNMRHMTWDPALAKTAKAWAKKCIFDHNTYLKIQGKTHPNFTAVGENIWTGSVSLFSVENAVRGWYNEVKDYNYEKNACSKVCGHYTQVVWATSYKVGCAVRFCPKVLRFGGLSNGAHFICNYGPAGNYPRKPYKAGRPCSECNGENCVDNLCEDPKRDQFMDLAIVIFQMLVNPCH